MFIVKVKQAEKDMRDKKAKDQNPTEDKDKLKIDVPNMLHYEHDVRAAMKVQARMPRRQDHNSEDDWMQAVKVRNFISQTPWCESREETEAGLPGITWLELYILFKMHDQKSKGQKQLKRKNSLQTDLACFKKSLQKS